MTTLVLTLVSIIVVGLVIAFGVIDRVVEPYRAKRHARARLVASDQRRRQQLNAVIVGRFGGAR